MAEVLCDTSPLQYLHQLGLLDLLPALTGTVTIPPAVRDELAVGKRAGVDLPNVETLSWIQQRAPTSSLALRFGTDLGRGEAEVLMLALETTDPLALLDDAFARRIAATLRIPFRGTLGVLLDAKQAGLVPAVRPLLDQLQALRFRLSLPTREIVLRLAGEAP